MGGFGNIGFGGAPAPVHIEPIRTDATNHSGAIAVGGSWQLVAPANPNRLRFLVENYSSSALQGIANIEVLLLNLAPTMPTSTDGAIEILPAGNYDSAAEVLNPGPIWIYAETTGHKFLTLEW